MPASKHHLSRKSKSLAVRSYVPATLAHVDKNHEHGAFAIPRQDQAHAPIENTAMYHGQQNLQLKYAQPGYQHPMHPGMQHPVHPAMKQYGHPMQPGMHPAMQHPGMQQYGQYGANNFPPMDPPMGPQAQMGPQMGRGKQQKTWIPHENGGKYIPSNVESRTILGVEKGASAGEIRKAYLDLVRQHHPDTKTNLQDGVSDERIKNINQAYEVLSLPKHQVPW